MLNKLMTKKKILTVALACALGLSAHAQLNGDGYYRIQNVKTGRYMTLADRHSRGLNTHTTNVDAGALQTRKLWSDIESDPGSVFYIKKVNNEEYNILGQGIDMHQLINYYIRIENKNGNYKLWQTNSGTKLYLSDENQDNEGQNNSFARTSGADTREWKIIPLDNSGDNHLGLTPTIKASNGKYYTTYLAGFPYSLQSEGMKAYTITTQNNGKGMVGYKEIKGEIPAKTPVLIECSSAEGKNNLIKPLTSTTNTISGSNKLTGVYFCIADWMSGHYNYVTFDASKQRILGVNAEGELVFNTAEENLVTLEDEDDNIIKAIPHNTAYLTVSSDTPKELKVTDEITAGVSHITIDTKNANDIYTLTGVKVRENATSTDGLPQGVYIFQGKKVVVK